jgi:hypothetical protein
MLYNSLHLRHIHPAMIRTPFSGKVADGAPEQTAKGRADVKC